MSNLKSIETGPDASVSRKSTRSSISSIKSRTASASVLVPIRSARGLEAGVFTGLERPGEIHRDTGDSMSPSLSPWSPPEPLATRSVKPDDGSAPPVRWAAVVCAVWVDFGGVLRLD